MFLQKKPEKSVQWVYLVYIFENYILFLKTMKIERTRLVFRFFVLKNIENIKFR